MDDGELDFSDHNEVFAQCSDLSAADSMDSFLDDLLKSTHACTHTHTCNPPGPDNTHTHTCIHTHTQIFGPTEEETTDSLGSPQDPSLLSEKKRPIGNREAVRKYREKKKAHTAYLEDQVQQLRALNQQLLKRLQGQAALEAETVRLRNVLAEFRGRIDAELGFCSLLKAPLDSAGGDAAGGVTDSFRTGGYSLNSFNVPCGGGDVPCFLSSMRSERGPSTPQEHQSLARGSGLSCEGHTDNCKKRRLEASKHKRGTGGKNTRSTEC